MKKDHLLMLKLLRPNDKQVQWRSVETPAWVKWRLDDTFGTWSRCHVANGTHTLCGIELLGKTEDEVVRWPHSGRVCIKCDTKRLQEVLGLAKAIVIAVPLRPWTVEGTTPPAPVSVGDATGYAGA